MNRDRDGRLPTFSSDTSSETSSSVKEEIVSTIGAILGETEEGPGWGAGEGVSQRAEEEEKWRAAQIGRKEDEAMDLKAR